MSNANETVLTDEAIKALCHGNGALAVPWLVSTCRSVEQAVLAILAPQVAQPSAEAMPDTNVVRWLFEDADWHIRPVRADGALLHAERFADLKNKGNTEGLTSMWTLTFYNDYGLKPDEDDAETAVRKAAEAFNHLYGKATPPIVDQSQPSTTDSDVRDAVPIDDILSLLPGVYYMDMPDGGSVTVLEQLRRTALDAEQYRALKSAPPATEAGERE